MQALHDALHELAVGGEVAKLAFGHLEHHAVVLKLLLSLEGGQLDQPEYDGHELVELGQSFDLLLKLRDLSLELLDLLGFGATRKDRFESGLSSHQLG